MTSMQSKKKPVYKRRTLFTRTVAVCAASVLLWTCTGLFLFVVPSTDPPTHTDVLFVLAPAPEKLDYAEQLMDQGYADTLAISVPRQNGKLSKTPCNDRRAYPIICFHPLPVTTQGEARAIQHLSKKYGWKSINVLTNQSHITRARVIVERCYKGDLRMLPIWRDLPVLSVNLRRSWAYVFAYESAAFVKVALNPDC